MFGVNKDDAFVPICFALPPTFNLTQQIYEGQLLANLASDLGIVAPFATRVLQRFPYSACAVPGDQKRTRDQCCRQYEQVFMDYTWTCSQRLTFALLANATSDASGAKQPLFSYFFDQLPTCPTPSRIVDHTVEIAYVFGVQSSYVASGLEDPCSWSAGERAFSDAVTDHWVAFATSLDASTPALRVPAFVPGPAEKTLYLKQDSIAITARAAADLERCESFWNPLIRDLWTDERKH